MYRWTWRTIYKNINWIFRDVYTGIKNVFVWLPIIWNDRNFDHEYLARIMEFKFRRMSHAFSKYGCRNIA